MSTTFTISLHVILFFIAAALGVTVIILNARTIKTLQSKQNKMICFAEDILVAVVTIANAACIITNNRIVLWIALALLFCCFFAIVFSSWVNHILFSISASKSGHLKIKLGNYNNITKQIKTKHWDVFFRHTDPETFRFTRCTHSTFMVSDKGKTRITLTGKTPLILIDGIIYILWTPAKIHKLCKTIFSQIFFNENVETVSPAEKEFRLPD